jgi:hypothetical protein
MERLMSQALSSALFSQRVKGDKGGPRATKGNDGTGDLSLNSGAVTYGGEGNGDFWQLYPGMIGGLVEYNPMALEPGSNREALSDYSEQSFGKVGGGAADAEIPPYGGTAAYAP